MEEYKLGRVVCPCGNDKHYVMVFRDAIRCTKCGAEAKPEAKPTPPPDTVMDTIPEICKKCPCYPNDCHDVYTDCEHDERMRNNFNVLLQERDTLQAELAQLKAQPSKDTVGEKKSCDSCGWFDECNGDDKSDCFSGQKFNGWIPEDKPQPSKDTEGEDYKQMWADLKTFLQVTLNSGQRERSVTALLKMEDIEQAALQKGGGK